MKVKVDGQEYEYNKEKYLKGVRERFPVPKNLLSRLLMNYPHDEKVFTTWFVKLYQVPEGYSVVYKVGGKVCGKRKYKDEEDCSLQGGKHNAVREAGYRFMIGLGGLLQSAHVLNTRPRLQDLVTESILTKDGVYLNKVDARLFYSVVHPEKAIAISEPDYRQITFGAALARITDYVGDNNIKDILKAKYRETNLVLDEDKNPLDFPTVKEAGVEMLELLIIDFPLEEPTRRLVEQEAAGEAEKQKRILNADAEKYELVQRGEGERQRRVLNAQAEYEEILQRGQAVNQVGEMIQRNPGAIFLRTLETYDEFAQGPNNTIFTVPEIKLNIEGIREKAEQTQPPTTP
ncbi:hypothetical protein J4221_02310 [Candidatus Pacearchaeota archaeon]|nr:hypothetical protein [Candidatus Pacearchaeota archaeon]